MDELSWGGGAGDVQREGNGKRAAGEGIQPRVRGHRQSFRYLYVIYIHIFIIPDIFRYHCVHVINSLRAW